jgi:hypothetical protein
MKRSLIAMLALCAAFSYAPVQAAQIARADFTITSAISVDSTTHTAVLPIYRGTANGKTVWYILTDASSAAVAKKYGVNYAPSLASIGNDATQTASRNADGSYMFQGAPDFSGARTYVASAGGFPPSAATPGGVADALYSPFVRAQGIAGVLNAPIVATGDGEYDVTTHANTEDRVLAIDTEKKTVTLALARGLVDGKPVYYLSPEASDATAASVERATFVARLAKARHSAEIPIGVVVNGPRTGSAPQGLAFLALDTPLGQEATLETASKVGSPFNVLSLAPDVKNRYGANGYSPLWNVVVVGEAQKTRLTSFAQVATISKDAGFVVNCPVVAYGDETTAGY